MMTSFTSAGYRTSQLEPEVSCFANGCSSIVKSCYSPKSMDDMQVCTAEFKPGDGACSKLVYCGVRNKKCELIVADKGDECVKCATDCTKITDHGKIDSHSQWDQCFRACAKKFNFASDR